MNPIRRIVTGHDETGKSVFLSIAKPPQHHHRQEGLVQFVEIWQTSASPAPITSTEAEPNERLPLRIPPDPQGSIIRVLDIYPGHVQALKPRADGRHPGTHRTETIDYGILLEGEIYMLLDDSEVLVRPGDIIIQRGTDHAWENRSQSVARIVFVLLDGKFSGELATRLKGTPLMATTLEDHREEGSALDPSPTPS
jgi:mannose-6-phosphate isomerase-like protein (cupin superfamily)